MEKIEKQLKKRGWKPVITEEGKLFTGWDGVRHYDEMVSDEPHKIWVLEIRPVTFSRGRSAADIIFEDRDGFKYDMKIGGAVKLLRKMCLGEIELNDGYLKTEIVQVKKGANVAIECVFDE